MKGHLRRIVISSVAVAVLIAAGILLARYDLTGSPSTSTTTAGSLTGSDAVGPSDCVEYAVLVDTEDHADGSKTYFYELDGNTIPITVSPGQAEPHPCKGNVVYPAEVTTVSP